MAEFQTVNGVDVAVDRVTINGETGDVQRGKLGFGVEGEYVDVSATDPLPIRGNGNRVAVNFTRPSDTTAYAALDTVCNSTSAPAVLSFAALARADAGSGYITKIRLETSQKTCTARFRLHLFHTTPTAINDNSPYLSLYADRDSLIGRVDLPACQTDDPTNSTCAWAELDTIRKQFVLATGSKVVYAILETLDAFTPANAQTFYLELTVDNY